MEEEQIEALKNLFKILGIEIEFTDKEVNDLINDEFIDFDIREEDLQVTNQTVGEIVSIQNFANDNRNPYIFAFDSSIKKYILVHEGFEDLIK